MANSDTMITPMARISFPELAKPKSFENQEPKYRCVLIFDKAAQADPRFKALKAAVSAVAKEHWGDSIPKNLRNPFRPGSDKDGMDGFDDDVIFISVTSKTRPGVVNALKEPIVDVEEEVYPGCHVFASVRAYSYDQKGNRGVAFGLNNILKVKDGERLGGGKRSAQEDFGEIEIEGAADAAEDADIFG